MKTAHNKLSQSMSFPVKSAILSVSIILFIFAVLTFEYPYFFMANADSRQPVVLTGEERDWLDNNSDKLTLFFNTEFPPIEFMSRDGKFVGMGADINAIVEERLGVKFLRKPCQDWNRHLAALESGECAIAPTIVRTEERERFSYFTIPYAVVPVVIISTENKPRGLTLEDLKGMRTAVVSGFATEKYVRDNTGGGGFEIITVNNVPDGLRALSFGQVDALVENLAVASYYIEKEGIPNLTVSGNTDYSFAWSIGVSRHYPLLFSSIQKALDSISEDELDKIKKRWISLEVSSWLNPGTIKKIKIVSIFMAITLMSLMVISYILKSQLNEKILRLKAAQQELIDQAERLKLAGEATNAGVWDYYPALKTIYVSEQWYTLLGKTMGAESIGMEEFINNIHPEDAERTNRNLIEYINKGGQGLFSSEYRMQHADGSWRWLLGKGKAIEWDESGQPERVIGLNIDIQNIREYQDKLAESERRFRLIFENAPYAIAINDLKTGHYLDANKALLNSFKIEDAALFSFSAEDNPAITMGNSENITEELLKNGVVRNREAIINRKDGSTGHIIFSSVLLDVGSEKQALSMVVDVTELKRAEDAIKEREETFRALTENSQDVIMRFDRLHRHTYANRAVEKVSGIPAEEFIGKTHRELGFPENLCKLWENALDEAFKCKDIARVEFQLPNGLWMDWLVTPEFDRDGNVNAVISSSRNITQRKEAEREKSILEDQLRQAVKMEAIGRLAGGVAHDFNNMLGVITGYTELARDDVEDTKKLKEDLDEISGAAERAANLTRQLLAFARKQTMAPAILDINEAVNGMLNMLRRLIGENIELGWNPGADIWRVKIDPSQVDQILANLCVNSRDAIRDIGIISIETSNIIIDSNFCETHLDFTPGEYVRLSLSDNGTGMDSDILEHAFEPFYTTKGLGQGTGLGLATVYGIVKQNHGLINIYSEVGFGTTVNIYLPRVEGEATVRRQAETEQPFTSSGETILIVEDEPAILNMSRIMLEKAGYKVLSAGDPSRALKLAVEHAGEIHLLMTDVIMPEMNGLDLYTKINSIRPGIKCLFISGYTSSVIFQSGIRDDNVHFLQKPFTLASLSARLHEALGKRK